MTMLRRFLLGVCVTLAALELFGGVGLGLRSLQMSNPGHFTMTGSNVSFEEEGGFLRTVCSGVTLGGEINERVAKRAGAAVGTVAEGGTTGCRAFGFVEATVTGEGSSNVGYNSILGTLPTITGILTLAEGVRVTIVSGGRTCRYEGRAGFLIPVSRGTYEGGSFLAEPKARILAGSTAECPAQGSLRGRLNFERQRTVTLV